jgi:hypothetical protein
MDQSSEHIMSKRARHPGDDDDVSSSIILCPMSHLPSAESTIAGQSLPGMVSTTTKPSIRIQRANGPGSVSLLVWIAIFTAPVVAFQPAHHTSTPSRNRAFLCSAIRGNLPTLYQTNNNDSDSTTDQKGKHSFSVARAGGRSPRRRRRRRGKKEKQDLGWFGPTLAFGLLAGLVFLWGLSGSDDNLYYYSYESSVYETTTHTMDGKVETSRKESRSARSNIPELRGLKPDDMRSGSSVFMLDQMGVPRLDVYLEDFFE